MSILSMQDQAETLFSEIRALSLDGEGVTRASYGIGESRTADFLADFAKHHGLAVWQDPAANLHFMLPGFSFDAPAIWCGSHIDSVPQGGNFDGLAGVIAGILCLLAQKKSGHVTPIPLRVVAFRGEESAWFGKAYVGSSALFGKLSAADLALIDVTTGESLKARMAALGADVESIAEQKLLVDPQKILAYLELHIEQGPVMIAKNIPLAVVSGIRGSFRHNRIACFGEAGHSGVIPRWLRQDTVFAIADVLMRLDEHWRIALEEGTDLVLTSGMMGTDPKEHAVTRIPGYASFSLDIRSRHLSTLQDFHALVLNECERVAVERHVRFSFDRRIDSQPAVLDEKLAALLSRACESLAIPYEALPSGAGHDAAIFANHGVRSGMLFIRNQNGSHNPKEAMDINDFMLGVSALSKTVDSLCCDALL